MSEQPTCKTCRWRWPGMHCRRFPPVPILGGGCVWPTTKDEDWCGEHPDLQPGEEVTTRSRRKA